MTFLSAKKSRTVELLIHPTPSSLPSAPFRRYKVGSDPPPPAGAQYFVGNDAVHRRRKHVDDRKGLGDSPNTHDSGNRLRRVRVSGYDAHTRQEAGTEQDAETGHDLSGTKPTERYRIWDHAHSLACKPGKSVRTRCASDCRRVAIR